MDKVSSLTQIASQIKNCKSCKKGKIGKPVPGEGNPDANVMFVGEAPGKKEAESGRPFIGRSGILLRENIKAIGLREQDVYITSPVKYLPKSGTPSPDDIKHGKKHFDKQVSIIGPKIIVLLGSVACQAVLEEKVPVAKLHGTIIEKEGKHYFISYHPAAAVRGYGTIRQDFPADFKKLQQLLAKNSI